MAHIKRSKNRGQSNGKTTATEEEKRPIQKAEKDGKEVTPPVKKKAAPKKKTAKRKAAPKKKAAKRSRK